MTTRTDAEAFTHSENEQEVVSADFARALERELADARNRLLVASKMLEGITGAYMTTTTKYDLPEYGIAASLGAEICRLDGPGTYTVIVLYGVKNKYGEAQIVLRSSAGSYPGDGAMNIILGEVVWRINSARSLERENKALRERLTMRLA